MISDSIDIIGIYYKGLRRFFESCNAKGRIGKIGHIRKMLAFIDAPRSYTPKLVAERFVSEVSLMTVSAAATKPVDEWLLTTA